MAYSDIYTAANDSAFQGRCWVAVWTLAVGILVESTGVANHDNRLAWAVRMLTDKANLTGKQLVIQVMRSGVINGKSGNLPSVTDAEIQAQVNAVTAELLAIG